MASTAGARRRSCAAGAVPFAGSYAAGAATLAGSYVAGGVPFAQLGARRRGVDLRRVGAGTVSGTGLFRVAGVGPLVCFGVLEVAKGAAGPLVAVRLTRRRDGLAVLAGAAAVAGHNWSPFLRGAGGRGISAAMGALLVTAPAGAGLLLAGLTLGRLAGETAAGCAVADLALVPTLHRIGGAGQSAAGAAVLLPIVAKRLTGNAPPARRGAGVYLRRLLLDRDTWAAA